MNVIAGVTAGVAAVKAPSLIRRLNEAGFEVRAAATDDAYHFVTALSLAVAAGHPVFDRAAWFRPDGRALHIELARWADVLLVAPATADTLGAAATGRADDVVSALVISGVPQVVWVPAMNTAMWEHPAVRHNVATLRGYGHQFIGPAEGTLAAKGEGAGIGRMTEPEEIVAELQRLTFSGDLAGVTVLVSAGPTREHLDPVRFLSNPSSGKMGYAVAAAAKRRGARTMLVSGPTSLSDPAGVEVVRVESATQMQRALSDRIADADILVMAAAVADWQAARPQRTKQKKTGSTQLLELVRTPDILEQLAERKGERVFVGFAVESAEGPARAADKARRKRLDFVCLNTLTPGGGPFGRDDNRVIIVTPDGAAHELPLMSKRALADEILTRALTRYRDLGLHDRQAEQPGG